MNLRERPLSHQSEIASTAPSRSRLSKPYRTASGSERTSSLGRAGLISESVKSGAGPWPAMRGLRGRRRLGACPTGVSEVSR